MSEAKATEIVTPQMVAELLSLERSLREIGSGEPQEGLGVWTRTALKNMDWLREQREGRHKMDPDLTLAQARSLIGEAHETDSDFQDLAGLVETLDGWLTQGGFLPEDWKRSERDAASRLRAARVALLMYGVHPNNCAVWGEKHEGGCTCGLTDAVAAASVV